MIRSKHTQSGLAVIELAISSSILLILFLLAAEFGRVFYQYNELTKAIRPATRYLSEHALTRAGVPYITEVDKQAARNLVLYGLSQETGTPNFTGLQADDISITYDTEHVTVNINWHYQGFFSNTFPLFNFDTSDIQLDNLQLQASLSMRMLN